MIYVSSSAYRILRIFHHFQYHMNHKSISHFQKSPCPRNDIENVWNCYFFTWNGRKEDCYITLGKWNLYTFHIHISSDFKSQKNAIWKSRLYFLSIFLIIVNSFVKTKCSFFNIWIWVREICKVWLFYYIISWEKRTEIIICKKKAVIRGNKIEKNANAHKYGYAGRIWTQKYIGFTL